MTKKNKDNPYEKTNFFDFTKRDQHEVREETEEEKERRERIRKVMLERKKRDASALYEISEKKSYLINVNSLNEGFLIGCGNNEIIAHMKERRHREPIFLHEDTIRILEDIRARLNPHETIMTVADDFIRHCYEEYFKEKE